MEMILNRLRIEHDSMNEEIKKKMGHDLTKIKINTTQIIQSIHTSDSGMRDFLFTLGCYEGQSIMVISKLGSTYVVNINNARYSIDSELARAIIV